MCIASVEDREITCHTAVGTFATSTFARLHVATLITFCTYKVAVATVTTGYTVATVTWTTLYVITVEAISTIITWAYGTFYTSAPTPYRIYRYIGVGDGYSCYSGW